MVRMVSRGLETALAPITKTKQNQMMDVLSFAQNV